MGRRSYRQKPENSRARGDTSGAIPVGSRADTTAGRNGYSGADRQPARALLTGGRMVSPGLIRGVVLAPLVIIIAFF